MNKGYLIVSRCLHDLQNLQIPRIKKLQIEIELLQAKRLLLVMRSEGYNGMISGKVDFEAFHAAFAADCSTSGDHVAVKLMSLAKTLGATLSEASEGTFQAPTDNSCSA